MNKQSDTAADNTVSKATRKVSVAIIGAGTAGQNAFRQASKTMMMLLLLMTDSGRPLVLRSAVCQANY
ncbi:hypothetical protein [Psychrobacter sp. TWP2-1-2]|uniref:hypothetical protein n=1 Tax=Psychrobacter sp. TWP2-1-2 TaxID=2804623 RepID=UPI003CFAB543